MKKILVIIIIGLFAYSCVSKKVVTEFKEVVKLDSVYIVKDRFITKQVNDTITIEQPCDSLGGLKDFERVIVSDKVKVSLKSVKGNIQATVDIDSIVNEKIKEYKSNFKANTQIKEVEVIKYKTPFYHWLIHIICALLIALLLKFK